MRGLARELGVTIRAVQKALIIGRLSAPRTVPHGKNTRTFFDVKKAKKEWLANTDGLKKTTLTRREMGLPPQYADVKNAEQITESNVEEKAKELPRNATSLSKARTAREMINLQVAQLDLKKRQGENVNIESAKLLFYKIANSVMNNMLAIPDRLSAVLAAEKDGRKINDLLKSEIKNALKAINDGRIKFDTE